MNARPKRRFALLACVTLLVLVSVATAQQRFVFGDPLPDAPELAARGPHQVGVRTVEVVNEDELNVLAVTYLNRLSDLLFILARYANREHGDVLWVPGLTR